MLRHVCSHVKLLLKSRRDDIDGQISKSVFSKTFHFGTFHVQKTKQCDLIESKLLFFPLSLSLSVFSFAKSCSVEKTYVKLVGVYPAFCIV